MKINIRAENKIKKQSIFFSRCREHIRDRQTAKATTIDAVR